MNRYFTTHEASRLLGVSLPTVVNWIDERRLRCHRTPGGHRRIAREELAGFMVRHGMPLPGDLADAAPGRRKALVVGEMGPPREGLTRQIAQLGWAVESAAHGFAAGAALARYQPHLVVLLPSGADGGDTLASLRSDREAGRTPVLAVGPSVWQGGLERAGANRALAFPAPSERLGEAMAELAGDAPARTPAAARVSSKALPRPKARGAASKGRPTR
jgi:excisionase family DNA binding protein